MFINPSCNLGIYDKWWTIDPHSSTWSWWSSWVHLGCNPSTPWWLEPNSPPIGSSRCSSRWLICILTYASIPTSDPPPFDPSCPTSTFQLGSSTSTHYPPSRILDDPTSNHIHIYASYLHNLSSLCRLGIQRPHGFHILYLNILQLIIEELLATPDFIAHHTQLIYILLLDLDLLDTIVDLE